MRFDIHGALKSMSKFCQIATYPALMKCLVVPFRPRFASHKLHKFIGFEESSVTQLLLCLKVKQRAVHLHMHDNGFYFKIRFSKVVLGL